MSVGKVVIMTVNSVSPHTPPSLFFGLYLQRRSINNVARIVQQTVTRWYLNSKTSSSSILGKILQCLSLYIKDRHNKLCTTGYHLVETWSRGGHIITIVVAPSLLPPWR